ncbi:MAG: molybdenum cofactor guanylyltransferase [Acidimicrobiales bacterium]|nr:molybdenum cofactor guanylyltransferase [Acidimicrobiales bacterium]
MSRKSELRVTPTPSNHKIDTADLLNNGFNAMPAGLLLTGGASRRMGRNKALIKINGTSSSKLVAKQLSKVTSVQVEVGPGYSGLDSIEETGSGSGPLNAIARGWEYLQSMGYQGPVLVAACDLPLINYELLNYLATHEGNKSVVPLLAGKTQPLCARWSSEALDEAIARFETGERSLRWFPEADGVIIGNPDLISRLGGEVVLSDIDTPLDLEMCIVNAEKLSIATKSQISGPSTYIKALG